MLETSRYQSPTLSSGCVGVVRRLQELTTACETALNIRTHLWNPLHALEQSGGIDTNFASTEAKAVLDEWGDTFAVPLGVALNAVNPATKVSLLPQEAVETLTQAARQRQLFAAAGLGVLLIGAILFRWLYTSTRTAGSTASPRYTTLTPRTIHGISPSAARTRIGNYGDANTSHLASGYSTRTQRDVP